VRAVAALLLFSAIVGSIGTAAAQDGDSASPSVGVSCWSDTASGGTACSFAPDPVGSVDWLSVPSSVFCAPVIDTGAASWDGDGVSQSIDDSNSAIILTFDGIVSAGGSASYNANVVGVGASTIGGSALGCDNSSDGGSVGSDEIDDPTEIPPDVPVVGTPDDGSGPANIDDTGDTPPSTIDEAPTDQTTSDVVNASITVIIYDCSVDPSGADPATVGGCLPSAGVNVSGTADSGTLGTQTSDGAGAATFSAVPNDAITFTEDASTVHVGYAPIGSGSVGGTASDGLVLTISNIASGRLQIVNGSCPTAGETRTEFRVIEPQSVTADATPACEVTPGASFTISGGGLSGAITVTTGNDGAWRGYLPAGRYTVADAAGNSTDVTVADGDISVVIAVDYVSAPLGVVNISRFNCTKQASPGIIIVVSSGKSSYATDANCTAVTGEVTIDVQSEVSTTSLASVQVGANGEDVELASGSYVLTDSGTGKTQSFDVSAGSRVYVAIVDKSTVGGTGVGGDDPDAGGSNGSGGSEKPTPHPGSDNGDNSGSDGSGVSDTGNSAVDSSSTDGSVDGDVGSGTDDVSAVNALPNTGTKSGDGSLGLWLTLLLALSALGVAGSIVVRRSQSGLK